jgi:hypothetical protein
MARSTAWIVRPCRRPIASPMAHKHVRGQESVWPELHLKVVDDGRQAEGCGMTSQAKILATAATRARPRAAAAKARCVVIGCATAAAVKDSSLSATEIQ